MRGPIAGFRGHLVTAAIVVAIAVGWLTYLMVLGGGLPSTNGSYRVQSVLPTAASLASNARVTMAGVEVGRVKSVERSGFAAVVTLEIHDDAVTPIPADSRVAVRQRTPVGENYVAIEPGRSATELRSGGVLEASQAEEYVDVDQILSALQGRTRARARELIQASGQALAGRGENLNRLLAGTSEALKSGASLSELAYRNREQISRLVEQLGEVSRAVGERGAGIRGLARDGLTTFRAIAERDDALRAILDQLPATLVQVRSTSNTLAAVTDDAAPVLRELGLAIRRLGPSVQLLRPAADEGRELLVELSATAPPLKGTLDRLRSLAPPTVKALPGVKRTLCELNPAVRYLKPYAPDITDAIVGMSSEMNAYDATGHTIRVGAVVDEQLLIGLPESVQRAVRTLVDSGLLHETRLLGYDPFPLPGSIGIDPTNKQGVGAVGPTDVTQKYPRIHADC